MHDTQSRKDIPLDSPLRIHQKRHLPPLLSSTYPHGHLSGHPRTGAQQAAFYYRKDEMSKTMSAKEIEKAYEEKAREIRELMAENERKNMEVEAEMEKLKMDWEMEKRVWGKHLRGMREGG